MATQELQQSKQIEVYEDERTIPLNDVQRAYDYFDPGSPIRVMFGMLALTGCRVKELDRMQKSKLYGDVLHWALGKRQRKHRRIKLPEWFLKDLELMHEQEPSRGDFLFPIASDSFCRYFLRSRDKLGEAWTRRVLRYRNNKPNLEFRNQLNGLRKNYMTILFNKNWRRWEDANVAMEMTSAEAKHSSTHITAQHYIRGFDRIGIKRETDLNPLCSSAQKSLGEWI